MQLNRGLLHIVFSVLFVFAFNSKLKSQALEDPMYSYTSLIDTTHIAQEILDEYKYIENNWYCLTNKEEILTRLLTNEIDSLQIEYLSYLRFVNFFFSSKANKALQVLKYIENKTNNVYPGILYHSYGRINGQIKNTSKAIENFNRAYEIFSKKNKDKESILVLNNLIIKYASIHDYKTAIEFYSKSLAICELHNYTWGFLSLYTTYGKSFVEYDIEQSREMLERGMVLAKSDTTMWGFRIKVAYLRHLLRYDNDENFRKLLDVTIRELESKCYHFYLGNLYTFKAHLYSVENKYDSAKIFNRKAINTRRRLDNKVIMTYSYMNLSNNLMKTGSLDESKLYLDSAYTIGKDIDDLHLKKTLLKQQIDYYIVVNNTDSLEKNIRELLITDDEYLREQLLFLSKNIELKNELNAKLEKEKYNLELAKRKQRIIYLILIAILLCFIVFTLVLQIKNKNVRFRNLRLIYKKDKQALIEYEKELEQLKNIFKNAMSGFVIIDKYFKIQYFNDSAYVIINSYYDLKIGKSMLDVLPADAKEEFKNKMSKISLNFDNQEQDIHVYDDKGKKFTYNVSFSPMIMHDEVESILLIINDISESVQSLELEKQQSKIQQTLLNSVTESMILIDKNKKIELINNTAASRFGGNIEDMIKLNYIDVFPEDLREFRVQKLNEVFEKKQVIVFNEEIESYNTLTCYYPDINKDGEVEFVAEFSQDITERKLASEQINSLRQKVLRSQMNPHFIFNSLNAIQSYVLKNDALKAVKYLNSFARLIRMILDSSRYDYINLKKEIDILKYYLELQQLRFGDKFVYQLDIDKNLDMDSLLIPAMLAQPFIENAIEHGLQHLENKGAVKISFIKKMDMVVFKVVDNGIGREASQKIQQKIQHKSQSLSTQLFQERLHTLNKISDKKITYNIVDLKDSNGVAKGTMVVINLPLIYKSDIKYI